MGNPKKKVPLKEQNHITETLERFQIEVLHTEVIGLLGDARRSLLDKNDSEGRRVFYAKYIKWNLAVMKFFEKTSSKFTSELNYWLAVKEFQIQPSVAGSEIERNTKISNEIEDIKSIIKQKYDILDGMLSKVKAQKSRLADEGSASLQRPRVFPDEGFGYLKYGMEGAGILIGKVNSQPYRLLQTLIEPEVGVYKTVESAFEAIREGLYKKATITNQAQKVQKIKYVIKELQKRNKLRGKLRFEFDEFERRIKTVYI